MEDIKSVLQPRLPGIELAMDAYCPKQMNSLFLERVYSPSYGHNESDLQKAICKPLWDVLNRGGKRWRPVLFLLVLEALGKDCTSYVEFSTVFEIIHNATLIIDDIEDDGKLRRGAPCVHITHGVDIAINAGNTAYFLPLLALQELEGIDDHVRVQLYQCYAKEMTLLHLGQGVDIVWHSGKSSGLPSVDNYLEMAAGKTGALSRMAVSMSAIIGGASPEVVQILSSFSETIGVAFQIQDDILDLTSSAFHELKGVGGDISEGKLSLVAIHALQDQQSKASIRLLTILRSKTSDTKEIAEAIEIMKQKGSFEFASCKARELVASAWKSVDAVLEESKAKKELQLFANFLIERQM